MTDDKPTCPLCEGTATFDDLEPGEVAGVTFRSVSCDATDFLTHPFPVRWLEGRVDDAQEFEDFEDRFVYVRGPLPEGSAIAGLFGDHDPIEAWIETEERDDGIRVMIRL